MMTNLAIVDNDAFEILDYEVKKEGITYTYDTITYLRKTYEADLYFIIGDDSLLDLLNWYKASELLTLCKFIVVSRPSYNNEEVVKHIDFLKKTYKAEILHLEFLEIGISSTQIRQKVYKAQSIKYLVPKIVQDYINKHKLYYNQLTLSEEFISEATAYVKKKLVNKRYAHTMGVVKMGLKLAQIHGVDMNKVFIGTLFHDVAKHMTPEEATEYEVDFDEFELKHPHTQHGKLGAALIKRDWDITDEDILNSIRFHTIARLGMSKLEQIVYLADMVEYSRGFSDELENLRQVCYKDLDEAMYLALIVTKNFVVNVKKMEIHPIVDKVIEQYRRGDMHGKRFI